MKKDKILRRSIISLESPRYMTDEGESATTWEQSIDLVPIEEKRHRDIKLHEHLQLTEFIESWESDKETCFQELEKLFKDEVALKYPNQKTNIYEKFNFFVNELKQHIDVLFSDLKVYKKNYKLFLNKKKEIADFLRNINFGIETEHDDLILKKMLIEMLISLATKYYFLYIIYVELSDYLIELMSTIKKESRIIISYFFNNYDTISNNIKSDYINYDYWKYVDDTLNKIASIYKQYLSNQVDYDDLQYLFQSNVKNASIDTLIFDRLFNISINKYFNYINLFK